MKFYGITWATGEESIAQTGYVYDSFEQAVRDAKKGPWTCAMPVDGMNGIYPNYDGGTLYGAIETEDTREVEVLVEAPYPPPQQSRFEQTIGSLQGIVLDLQDLGRSKGEVEAVLFALSYLVSNEDDVREALGETG